jgi:hypothetical protein
MNRLSLFPLLLTMAAITPFSARASELLPGEHVRVDTLNKRGYHRQITGDVVSVDDKMLVVISTDERDTDTHAIPRNKITGVERYTGTQRHTAIGAVIGAGAGFGLGLGALAIAPSWYNEGSGSHLFVLGMGVLGAGLGALIGHVDATEQWESVDGYSVSLAPAATSTGVIGVSLNFGF